LNNNPYSAPVSEADDAVQSQGESKLTGSGWAHAKGVFLAWEKLRFLYNFVLVFLVVALAVLSKFSQLLGSVEFWLIAIAGGIISNICFFLGPIVESYVHWLGLRLPWFRPTCFVLGLVLTAIVAMMAVVELAWKV